MNARAKVFVNAIPKAGTNLVARALDLLGFVRAGHIGAGQMVGTHLLKRVRRALGAPLTDRGYLIGIDFPIEVRRSRIDRLLHKTRPGAYLTAHVGYTDDLLHTVSRLGFRSIVVVRDPRAIVASMVPYILKNHRHPMHQVFKGLGVEERYRVAFTGFFGRGVTLQSLYTRYLAIQCWIDSEYTLTVKFEDLVGPAGGGSATAQERTLAKICSHLGISSNNISEVQSHLFGPGSPTFRKGQVDSWKQEIPVPIQEEISTALRPILYKFGYIS